MAQFITNSDGRLTVAKCFTYIIFFNSHNTIEMEVIIILILQGRELSPERLNHLFKVHRELKFANTGVKF